MIVKDEGMRLGACLDSLICIADEIIIVDTGSKDDTKAVAAQYTDKIFDYPWKNDFAAARNFAFSKATGDYVYSADADEVIDAMKEVGDKMHPDFKETARGGVANTPAGKAIAESMNS